MDVELEVLHSGTLKMPDGYAFRRGGGPLVARLPRLLRGGGEALRAPVLAFLVRHPSAGPVLIDTGMRREAAENPRGEYGPVGSLMFRSFESSGEDFEQQLRSRGVDPADVKTVVMTHLHLDHTSGMRLLPNAEFVIAGPEWAAATGRSAALGGYIPKHLPDASRVRQIDFAAEGGRHGPFERTLDLLGDGTLRLVSTPGHSKGHLSVLVRMAGGREVLLVGDAAYTLRSIREQVLPLFTVDDDRYRRSLREIAGYADANPTATLVPTHDPDAWRAV